MNLICTATLVEKNSILNALKQSNTKEDYTVLATGIGFENARNSLTKFLNKNSNISNIISLGFAGAIKGLEIEDWVLAKKIYLKDKSELSEIHIIPTTQKIKTKKKIIDVNLITINQIYKNTFDKEITQNIPWAADMESAVYAQIATASKIPFTCIRMITDTPENPLPEFISAWANQNESRMRAFLKTCSEFLKTPKENLNFLKRSNRWRDTFTNNLIF